MYSNLNIVNKSTYDTRLYPFELDKLFHRFHILDSLFLELCFKRIYY